MIAESQIKNLNVPFSNFVSQSLTALWLFAFKYLEKLSKQLSNLNEKAQISVYNAKLTFHNFYQFSIYYERT